MLHILPLKRVDSLKHTSKERNRERVCEWERERERESLFTKKMFLSRARNLLRAAKHKGDCMRDLATIKKIPDSGHTLKKQWSDSSTSHHPFCWSEATLWITSVTFTTAHMSFPFTMIDWYLGLPPPICNLLDICSKSWAYKFRAWTSDPIDIIDSRKGCILSAFLGKPTDQPTK